MLTKYADLEVLEVKTTNNRLSKGVQGERLASFEHLPKETYKTDDDYMYVKVRAISSRVNKNHDGWPTYELAGMSENKFKELVASLDTEDKEQRQKTARVFTARKISTRGDYGFKTFVGRPIFVDHNNSDPERTRGVIVDSLLHIEPSDRKLSSDNYWSDAPENHKPETWIELLLEVDAKAFPKLAKAFENGDIDSVSMGCNVEHTTCNICGNEAADVEDYCNHIRRKGSIFHSQKHGKKMKAYEDCHGINFFEISAVFDPADETALFTDKPIIKKVADQNATVMFQPTGELCPKVAADDSLSIMDDAANLIYAAQASIKINDFDTALEEIEQAIQLAEEVSTSAASLLRVAYNRFERGWNSELIDKGKEGLNRALHILTHDSGAAQASDDEYQSQRRNDIKDKWQVQKNRVPGERLKWESSVRVSVSGLSDETYRHLFYFAHDFYPDEWNKVNRLMNAVALNDPINERNQEFLKEFFNDAADYTDDPKVESELRGFFGSPNNHDIDWLSQSGIRWSYVNQQFALVDVNNKPVTWAEDVSYLKEMARDLNMKAGFEKYKVVQNNGERFAKRLPWQIRLHFGD